MNPRQVTFIENDLADLFAGVELYSGLKNKKIFITGAAGFVGQWLVLAFSYLNRNFGFNIEVVATSRRLPPPGIIGYLSADINITFSEVDVRSAFSIPADTDFVIHLAGSPDRREHASLPLEVIETIVNGTENLFKACTRLNKVSRILNFTSGHTPGKMQKKGAEFFYTATDCLNFGAAYSESKRLSETLAHIYKSQFYLPVSIVRPFSFIGPLQLLERPWAINNFIRDALHRGKVKVLGNPDTLKSYLYPTDMVSWILQYLLSSSNSDEPLNLGSVELVSLSESAEKIAAAAKGASVEYSDPQRTQPRQDFYPESGNSALTQGINFPRSVLKTIDWFRISD